jgi:L-asparaginase/Glu-tRNA(Gln) amidotransferase subunit D
MIDVVDAKTNQLVWEGVGRGRLTKSEIDDIANIASNAVSVVMSQYQFRAAP